MTAEQASATSGRKLDGGARVRFFARAYVAELRVLADVGVCARQKGVGVSGGARLERLVEGSQARACAHPENELRAQTHPCLSVLSLQASCLGERAK